MIKQLDPLDEKTETRQNIVHLAVLAKGDDEQFRNMMDTFKKNIGKK